MSGVGPDLASLPAAKPMPARLARRAPGAPAVVVSDSDALTPYMSHVVPGCEFLLLTATDMFVRTSSPTMFVVPAACQPLCAPHFTGWVFPIESITETKRPSLPRLSLRSMYRMQADPATQNAAYLHRSVSTANCGQRCCN